MKQKQIGETKYEQWMEENGNIICTCEYGSLYPANYIEGKKVCRHIKELLKHEHNKIIE